MKDLTDRVLILSVELLFVWVITVAIVFATSPDFALYLFPINAVIVIYLFLAEVDQMIDVAIAESS